MGSKLRGLGGGTPGIRDDRRSAYVGFPGSRGMSPATRSHIVKR